MDFAHPRLNLNLKTTLTKELAGLDSHLRQRAHGVRRRNGKRPGDLSDLWAKRRVKIISIAGETWV